MRKAKVLITGIDGFAGKHMANQLGKKYEIIGMASPRSLVSDTDGVKRFKVDITDGNAVHAVLSAQRPDFIIHLAAQTTAWFENPTQLFDVNLQGTINVYESVTSLRAESKYDPKILCISSSEVYGRTTKPELIDEDAPFFPVNHYASSKAAADRVSYDYSQSNKLNIVILRAFTHTGPGKKFGTFVSDMASQIVRLEKNPNDNEICVGNLDAVRDYLDVRDVVNAYKLVMEADLPRGTALNVCSGKGVKIRDLLDSMVKLAQKDIVIKTDPKRMRPSDVPTFIGDHTRLTKATGWTPSIPLSDTLVETLEYWREHIEDIGK